MTFHPFSHLGLKIFSIALAVLLWLMVAGDQIAERVLRVPLEFRNTPEQLEMVGDTIDVVDVRVRGPSGMLSRLQPGDLVIALDLRTAKVGRRLFALSNDQVSVPFGVEIVQVFPGTIPIEFELSRTRTVPVVPAIEGEPASGFEVAEVRSDPPAVEVVGPEGRLKRLTAATTEPISVAGARSTIQENATIGLLDERLRMREPRDARVTIEIKPSPLERTIHNVPLTMRNLGSGLSAQPTPAVVSVRIRGAADVLSRINTDSIQAYADVAGLDRGRYNLRVRVEPSNSFAVEQVQPAVVQVRIK